MNRLFETELRQPDVPLGATPPDWSALERRSRIAMACLMACAAIDTLSVVAGLFEIELLMRIRDDRGFTDAEVASNDRMMLILGMLYLAVYLLTVVFFCRWMLQAYRTVLATQPGRVSYTAREAVASFFIPFVNLIRPYRAMRELVDASTGPDGPPGALVRTWWAAYLAMGMLGNLSARLSWRADDAFELIASTWVTIAADAVSVPAAFLAVYLVRRISSGLPVTLASAHL